MDSFENDVQSDSGLLKAYKMNPAGPCQANIGTEGDALKRLSVRNATANPSRPATLGSQGHRGVFGGSWMGSCWPVDHVTYQRTVT